MSEIQLPVGQGVDWSSAMAAVKAEELRRKTGQKLPAPRVLENDEWPPDYDSVYAWRQAQLAAFEKDPKLLESAKAYYKHHGKEFICHWCDVYEPRNAGTDKPVWMPFILFVKQAEFIDFINCLVQEQQPGLVEKSRTMGATWCAVGWSVHRWLFWDGSTIGWGSQDANSVDRIGDPKSIFEKMRLLIRRLPSVFQPSDIGPEALKQYVCKNVDNGSSIIGEVGDNIGRGGRSLVYFKDESAHYKRPEKVEASLSENTNVPIDISSVNGLGNLFQRRRQGGIDWEPGKEIPRGHVRVMIMDWSAHPDYDFEWFKSKKSMATRQGTYHIFAQEIERNYAASVEGVIIPSIHVEAAVDAHKILGIEDDGDGNWGAGLDVADGGLDRNAFTGRQGVIAKICQEWSERDPGLTARRAIGLAEDFGECEIMYDCIGVGVGVKTEVNRLRDDNLIPAGLKFVKWDAGGAVLNPSENIIPNDPETPTNKKHFENIKAQAWFVVAQRFLITYRAVMKVKGTPLEGDEDFTWDPSQIISLSSKMPLLQKLKKELSQPTMGKSARLKMMINKMPEGTTSPNLGDSFVMAYFPVPSHDDIFGGLMIGDEFAGPTMISG